MTTPPSSSGGNFASEIISSAQQLVSENIPYQWGGWTQFGLDCSSFVSSVFEKVGVTVGGFNGSSHGPDTYAQVNYGANVPLAGSDGTANAVPSDVLFFDVPGEGANAHEGIYAGRVNGTAYMFDEPDTGGKAQYVPITGFGQVDAIRQYVNPDTGTPEGNGISTTGGSGSYSFAQQLGAFMYAIGTQESDNNYNSPLNAGGAEGYYQFQQGTSMFNAAQQAGWTPAIQNQIAANTMTADYQGPAEQDWTKVAEMWNGGVPYPVPNPALGPGATTADYAAEVMTKYQEDLQEGLSPYNNGGSPILTNTSSSGSSSQSNQPATDATPSSYETVNPWNTVLQYIDAFLNPKVSAVPGFVNVFTGINSAVSAVLTAVDRLTGALVGILVFAGGTYLVLAGDSGGGTNNIWRYANYRTTARRLALGERTEDRRARNAIPAQSRRAPIKLPTAPTQSPTAPTQSEKAPAQSQKAPAQTRREAGNATAKAAARLNRQQAGKATAKAAARLPKQ